MPDNKPLKTERLNLRCSADAVATLRDAAIVQGQDLTSFILGAALERARAVLAEDRLLRLERVVSPSATNAQAPIEPSPLHVT